MAAQVDSAALQAQVAEGLANLAEILAPVREAVEGYRTQSERDGYSDELARRMAVDYHSALLRMAVR